jgi:hypothetical protein
MQLLVLGAIALLMVGLAARGGASPPRPSTEGARDITRAQAERWLDLQMNPPIDPETGEPIADPLVLNIKQRGPGMWLIDGNAPIEGVEFRYNGKKKVSTYDIVATPNMLVLLVRLARFLRSRDVTRVYHAGIFPGVSKDPTNAHNRGEAIDLTDFIFQDGDQLSVLKDWGNKPKPVWIAGSVDEHFRLLPSEKGYTFFRALYRFLSQEATDRGSKGGKSLETTEGTRIGEHSYILTPDHPTPYIAQWHANHFHAQVGPTSLGH